jgi:hypothetical protein
MFGGHWNSTGPSRSPSGAAFSRNATADSGSVNLRKCVMPCFAFSTKRNGGGVAATHASRVFGLGSRRKV